MLSPSRSTLLFILGAAPAAICVVGLLWWPISNVIYYSFTNFDGFLGTANWVGLRNYIKIFTDPAVATVLQHTSIYSFFYVVLQPFIAFLLANALTSGIRGAVFYQAIFFIPVVISPVGATFAWSFLYDPNVGPINSILSSIGLGMFQPDWLGDFDLALYSVIIVDFWRNFGFSVVIFVAGLSMIPKDLLEASKVDGANAFQTIRTIVIPQMRTTIGLVLILAINGAFRAFDTVYLLTRGGPGTSTELYMTKTFKEAFTNQNFGYGAAMSVLLLIVLLAATMVQRRISQNEE